MHAANPDYERSVTMLPRLRLASGVQRPTLPALFVNS